MRTIEVAAIVTALLGCVTDLTFRRIPNVLTLGAALAALIFHLFSNGAGGLLLSLSGWAVALLIFLPFFWLGGMGGGDVKLLAALGAWLGPGAAVVIALWTALVGGAMALILAIATGYLLHAWLNLRTLAGHWLHTGFRPHPAMTLDSSGGPRLPYALPIAAGLMVTLWLR